MSKMNKKAFFLSVVSGVLFGFSGFAQTSDSIGCEKFVAYQYDRFTEEKEVWTADAVTLLNSEGTPTAPLLANSYKIQFYNTLTGKQLDKFDANMIVTSVTGNNDQLKGQKSDVTLYLIFSGNKKFNMKVKMTSTEDGYKIDLPFQGEVLLHYKTKKLKALRLSGNSIGNIDFDLDSDQSVHLLNELTCMFSYK